MNVTQTEAHNSRPTRLYGFSFFLVCPSSFAPTARAHASKPARHTSRTAYQTPIRLPYATVDLSPPSTTNGPAVPRPCSPAYDLNSSPSKLQLAVSAPDQCPLHTISPCSYSSMSMPANSYLTSSSKFSCPHASNQPCTHITAHTSRPARRPGFLLPCLCPARLASYQPTTRTPATLARACQQLTFTFTSRA